MNSGKFLSEFEMSSLRATLTQFMERDFRNTTLIWVLIVTGARVSEVLNLRSRDLDRMSDQVFIRGLKGSRDRELPVNRFVFSRLVTLCRDKGEDDLIFGISYCRAKQIWNEYRPVRKRIHSIRHWRAFNIYRRTKDIKLVQRVLGHRSINNTMVYLDYDYSRDELARALVHD